MGAWLDTERGVRMDDEELRALHGEAVESDEDEAAAVEALGSEGAFEAWVCGCVRMGLLRAVREDG